MARAVVGGAFVDALGTALTTAMRVSLAAVAQALEPMALAARPTMTAVWSSAALAQ